LVLGRRRRGRLEEGELSYLDAAAFSEERTSLGDHRGCREIAASIREQPPRTVPELASPRVLRSNTGLPGIDEVRS